MRQTAAALECVYLLSSPEKVAPTLVSARRVVTTRFAVPSSNGSCFAAGAEIEAMAGGELEDDCRAGAALLLPQAVCRDHCAWSRAPNGWDFARAALAFHDKCARGGLERDAQRDEILLWCAVGTR